MKYIIISPNRYLFFLAGTVEVLAYPSLKVLHTLVAHTAGCYCIAIDPIGRWLGFSYLNFLLSSSNSYMTMGFISWLKENRMITK